MLTAAEQRDLATVGHTRIPGVLGPPAVAELNDRIWDHLARRGIDRHDPTTWPTGLVSHLQGLRQAGVFDPFGEALGIGGEGGSWGPALVTFPEREPWLVPHASWHLDMPGRGEPTQLRLFGYATDVGPWGGATLVVQGSHELVRRMVESSKKRDVGSSATVRRRLQRSHPWFEALFEPTHRPAHRLRTHMTDGVEIDGVHVRVVELTADAGDVVVMLPWTLHSRSTNAAARPRFAATHTIEDPHR